MVQKRWNRDEFYDRVSGMDDAQLKKILWTLYWRGAAQQRARIEALVDPATAESAKAGAAATPEPATVLNEVKEFASLARSGAYMASDRRVSPRERTRWRHTFRRLAKDSVAVLKSDDVDTAEAAVATLVDLACHMWGHDLFHSEDPVEAARFVVSDAVKSLWLRRREHDLTDFVNRAPGQLLRWESKFGWARHGEGWTAAQETTLAEVAAEVLTTPDMWTDFAWHYVEALKQRDGRNDGTKQAQTGSRRKRVDGMEHWHEMLRDRLAGSADESLLDRIP